MQGFAVLKAYDLARAPIDVSDCFGRTGTRDDNASFTSMVRVGFTSQMVTDGPTDWWSREITMSEYQLYRWLLDHGADDGETVLVCWPGACG